MYVNSMSSEDTETLIKILQTLAKMEERDVRFFEAIKDIQKHVSVMNEEMGILEKRVGDNKSMYFECKANYDKMSFYWKAISFVISPIATFSLIILVKWILGMPIP